MRPAKPGQEMHLTLRRREGWVIGDTENRFASAIKAPARSLRLFAPQRRCLFSHSFFPMLLSSPLFPCPAVPPLYHHSQHFSICSLFPYLFSLRVLLPLTVPRSRKTNCARHSQSSLFRAFRYQVQLPIIKMRSSGYHERRLFGVLPRGKLKRIENRN